MIGTVNLDLEPSVACFAREGFQAINFLELAMNLKSNTTEALAVKENGAFHVRGWSSLVNCNNYDLSM